MSEAQRRELVLRCLDAVKCRLSLDWCATRKQDVELVLSAIEFVCRVSDESVVV